MDDWRMRGTDLAPALRQLLLPAVVPVVRGARMAAGYTNAVASRSGAGAFFDVVALDDGTLSVFSGDVSGVGNGALVGAFELRTLAVDRALNGAGPCEFVAELARWCDRRLPDRTATLCAVRMVPASGSLEYCTAGHPPPLIISPLRDEPRFLSPTGAGPLSERNGRPVLQRDSLAIDDVLVLLTNGLVDRGDRTPMAATADVRRISARVTVNRTARPERSAVPGHAGATSDDVVDALLNAAEPGTTVGVFAVQRCRVPDPLACRLVSGPHTPQQASAALSEWLDDADVAGTDLNAVRYTVTELVSNASRHAYPDGEAGPVTLEAAIEPAGSLRLTVADQGSWRSGTVQARAPGHGAGLPLLRQLVDDLQIRSSLEGTAVTVRTALRRPVEVRTARRLPAVATPGPLPGPVVRPVMGAPPAGSEAGEARVVLRGTLDEAAAQNLRAVLGTLLEPRGGNVLVDLVEVVSMVATAVVVLREAIEAGRQRQVDVTLLAPNGTAAHEVLSRSSLPHITEPRAPR